MRKSAHVILLFSLKSLSNEKTIFLHYASESNFDSRLYIVIFKVILSQRPNIFASNNFLLWKYKLFLSTYLRMNLTKCYIFSATLFSVPLLIWVVYFWWTLLLLSVVFSVQVNLSLFKLFLIYVVCVKRCWNNMRMVTGFTRKRNFFVVQFTLIIQAFL